MPKVIFITFEEIDGSGKTTQLRRLVTWLESQGAEAIVTRQPGGTDTGEHIRSLLLDAASTGISPHCELGLILGSRASACRGHPASSRGREDCSLRSVHRFDRSLSGRRGIGLRPGAGSTPEPVPRYLAGYHDLAPARFRGLTHTSASPAGPGRCRRKPFRTRTGWFYHRVYDKYCEIATREWRRVIPFTCNCAIDVVHQEIVDVIGPMLVPRQAIPMMGNAETFDPKFAVRG